MARARPWSRAAISISMADPSWTARCPARRASSFRLPRRHVPAGPAVGPGAGRQGQYGVRRGAVRVRLAQPEGRVHVRPAAVAHRGADPGAGSGHRQAGAGQVQPGRYRPGPRPVDHLRREPVAVEHPSGQRGIRAGRDHRARLGAVPGLQPQPVRRCGQGQSVSLWAPARSGGPPGRHRHHQEALLPGPHLARADPGHARPAHLSDGRRRHQRRAVHVRGRPQGRSVGRHALRRQVAPDLGEGPGPARWAGSTWAMPAAPTSRRWPIP